MAALAGGDLVEVGVAAVRGVVAGGQAVLAARLRDLLAIAADLDRIGIEAGERARARLAQAAGPLQLELAPRVLQALGRAAGVTIDVGPAPLLAFAQYAFVGAPRGAIAWIADLIPHDGRGLALAGEREQSCAEGEAASHECRIAESCVCCRAGADRRLRREVASFRSEGQCEQSFA